VGHIFLGNNKVSFIFWLPIYIFALLVLCFFVLYMFCFHFLCVLFFVFLITNGLFCFCGCCVRFIIQRFVLKT